MSSFAHGEELAEILSFVEVLSLKDIKDYWKITDNIRLVEFTRFESIEIHYESDELRASKKNIRDNFQSLGKAKEFIVFLIHNERLSRAVARKIVTINEFYAIFEPDDVLNILYRAEEYIKCIDYYEHSELSEVSLYERALETPQSIEEIVALKIEREELHKAIQTLPEIQRRRLILYYFEELTYEEIAEMERCSYPVARRSVLAAIENLKKYLE